MQVGHVPHKAPETGGRGGDLRRLDHFDDQLTQTVEALANGARLSNTLQRLAGGSLDCTARPLQ